MKKIILFLLSITFILQSCGMSEKKRKENEEKRQMAISEALELARKDSIVRIEEKIALGDIMFGISESLYDEKEASFLNKCKLSVPETYTTKSEYSSKPREREFKYKIGEYGFDHSSGMFYHDSLYKVWLAGVPINLDDYDTLMKNQYNALFGVLTEKYGKPSLDYGYPELSSLKEGPPYYANTDYYSCIWRIGRKRININLWRGGDYLCLFLIVYLPEIEEKAQKLFEQELEREEIERKEQELRKAKKGASLL